MMSPLEYLFFALFSAQNPDPEMAGVMNGVAPSAGEAQENALVINKNGHFEMKTILMEPRERLTETLEAPLRITPEWVPAFKIGAPMAIKIDETGKIYDGKIVRIESITDENGVSVQAIAALDKAASSALEPGMTALATMTATN